MKNEVRAVATKIATAGGNPLLVGGAVIDMLQGKSPKDFDIEVFGINYEQLLEAVREYSPETVGKAFGVIKIRVGDLDLDLSLPRRDSKSGQGHKGFTVEVDPGMNIREAARRRDFTINAMSMDILTGDIHDPFGGQTDLANGILRVVDPETFVEDPLRALRAMQLLARKAKVVAPESMSLIRSMSDQFTSLPKERVYEEFKKLLMKADKPSVGLEFLAQSGWMVHFPELTAMQGCEQKEDWHPEGDVWTHACLAADAAASIRHLVPEHQREAFMFGTFLHDAGKPATTITRKMIVEQHPVAIKAAESAKKPLEEMLLTAHGHDVAGVEPATRFMNRITNATELTKLVAGIVELHMQPGNLQRGQGASGAYARLHRKMLSVGGDLALIGRVCQCDACATGRNRSLKSGEPDWEHKSSQILFEHVTMFEERKMVEPKVMGRDLIALGMKPGIQFRALLEKALEIQDNNPNLTKEDILKLL